MTLRKYAKAMVLGAEIATRNALGIVKASHRAVFNYEPRAGYLYVRSRMISSRTNDNFDDFPAEEILASWKTAVGKPAFVNHHNETHKRMRGVIIDAVLHEDTGPDGRPDIWIEALHEIDATRFPKLAEGILSGRINRTSMGTDVGFSVCSACGNKATTPAEYCQHIPAMKGKILYRHTASGERQGHLIREICHKLSFFENSFLVEDPADPTAVVTGIDDRGLKATATMRKGAPFAGYEDFDDCTEKNSDKDSPDEYCGEVKHRTEGRLRTLSELTDPGHNCLNCGREMMHSTDGGFKNGVMPYKKDTPGLCYDCATAPVSTRPQNHPGSLFYAEPGRGGSEEARHLMDSVDKGRGRHWEPDDYVRHSLSSLEALAGRNAYDNPADHPFFLKNPVSADNVVDAFNSADEGRKAQGMRWYSDAHHVAGLLADGDHAKGAGVLAAYSPKAAWPDNMFNAARSFQEGRALGKGEGASIMGQHQRTAQKVMDGTHHSQALKSPKISDFAHLIEHGDDTPEDKEAGKTRVVIDRHALSVATGRRMSTEDLNDAPLANRHYYEHVADTYREASRRLSDQHGETIKPHQVQAVTWGVQQEANQTEDEAEGGRGKGRTTRTKNSWTRWGDESKSQYPGMHAEPPNLHGQNPYANEKEAMFRLSSLPSLSVIATAAADDDNLFHLGGTHHAACGRYLPGRRTAALHVDESRLDRPADPSIQPVRHVLEGARAYAHGVGLDDPHRMSYSDVGTNPARLRSLAHAYHELPMDDPDAHKAFSDMAEQVRRQHDHLTGTMGVKVEPVSHDPYPDVQAMAADMRDNKRLQVLGTHVTGGHPHFDDQTNDMFRAVHDAFGHAATGRGFDRHGEEAAWLAHRAMFHGPAKQAMTTETRGQNATLIATGGFAPQKIALLPDRYLHRHAQRTSSLPSVTAYGETKAPADVDTLRAENCPVCGEGDSFDGDRCEVCHFIQPPDMFTDPDTGVAKQMDLRQDQFDQGMVGPNGQPLPDVDAQEQMFSGQEDGVPGQPGDQVGDLFCPACGFSADTQVPTTDNDPSMPSPEGGLMEGDVCPQCGQATMLSPNDVGEMGGEVPQEIAGDADADAVPDDQEPDEDRDGVPDDAEPDVDADGIPDDAEPDADADQVPDDVDPDPEDPAVPGEEAGPDDESAPDAVEDDEEAPKKRKDNSRAARKARYGGIS